MKRELLIAGLGLVALLLVAWLGVRMLYPPEPEPTWTPTPAPSATAEPTTPPAEQPPPDEEDEPPLVGEVRVCCYGMAPYGPGRNRQMSGVAARLHAMGRPEHTHDLFGMRCPSEEAEALALRRVLLRPAEIEVNPRERLAMADRRAHQERVGR